MKTKPILPFLIVLTLVSCATQQIAGDRAAQVRNFVQNIEPSIRPAVAAACGLGLSLTKDDASKAAFKKALAQVTGIVASLTPDQTPGQLSKSIQAVLASNPQKQTIADAIAGAYGIALPFIRDDSKLFLKVITDIAAGINDVVASTT